MTYPMIERLGLPISAADTWVPGTKVVQAGLLEKLLSEAPVVYNSKSSVSWDHAYKVPNYHDQCALLVGIQPIVKDTAESLLREAMNFPSTLKVTEWNSWHERAKRLMEGK